MRAGTFSATALTRFYTPSILRQREGTTTGRDLLKFSPLLAVKKCGGVLWMAQRLREQQQQQRRRQRPLVAAAACAAVPGRVGEGNEGECRDSFGAGARDAGAEPTRTSSSSLVVVSFYKFAELPDYAELRAPLRRLCDAHQVSGGIILAPEGINGSICGTRESVENVFAVLQADQRLVGIRRNEAPATEEEGLEHGQTSKSPLGAGDDAPFRWGHVRVKLKAEVVPLGVPDVRPSQRVGKYVKPKDWNALIADPETVVVDVRNDYETRIGKFKGAMDPQTESFRDFPSWAENSFGLSSAGKKPSEYGDGAKDPPDRGDGEVTLSEAGSSNCSTSKERPARIAMYCTGGIRCEKATSYLMERGFDEIYHLEGGILKYLEQVAPAESMWEGECFVFDKRVSVDHGLKQGTHTLCYACKKPVNDGDKLSPLWEEGVSCPFCFNSKSPEEKDRARARQIQFRETGVIGGPGNGRKLEKKSEDSRSP